MRHCSIKMLILWMNDGSEIKYVCMDRVEKYNIVLPD